MSPQPTLRARAEHAAKYDTHLVVPARTVKALLDERDALVAAVEAAREALSAYTAFDHSDECGFGDCPRHVADEALAALDKHVPAERDALAEGAVR